MPNPFRALLIAGLFASVAIVNNTRPADASSASNGNTDMFILEAAQATDNLSQAQVIDNFDWFNDGDKIGLTGGLTEDDLDYEELIDFDQDGFEDDTVVKLKLTKKILGVILDADDFVLAGEFFPVDIAQNPVLCLEKANVSGCETVVMN